MEVAEKYIKLVCDYMKLDRSDIMGKSRKGDLPTARHWISYLLDKHTDLSLNKIARAINSPSHCSAMHGIKKTRDFLEVEKKFRIRFQGLLQRAERLQQDITMEENIAFKSPDRGDLCWFWENVNSVTLPVLGRFEAAVIDGSGRMRYLVDGSDTSYANCECVPHSILPEQYRNRHVYYAYYENQMQ